MEACQHSSGKAEITAHSSHYTAKTNTLEGCQEMLNRQLFKCNVLQESPLQYTAPQIKMRTLSLPVTWQQILIHRQTLRY